MGSPLAAAKTCHGAPPPPRDDTSLAEGLSHTLQWVGQSQLEPDLSSKGQPWPLLIEATPAAHTLLLLSGNKPHMLQVQAEQSGSQ